MDHHVARRRGDDQELAHQTRLSDPYFADEARTTERPRFGAAVFEPGEVFVATEERQHPLRLEFRTLRGSMAGGDGGRDDARHGGGSHRWSGRDAHPLRRSDRAAAVATELLGGRIHGPAGPAADPPQARCADTRAVLDFVEGVAERSRKLVRVLVSGVRLLGEAPEDDGDENLRNAPLGGDLARVPRRAREVGEHDLGRRVGLEGEVAGQELIENDADGVEIAPRIERVAAGLLGAHVFGRTAHDPRARDASLGRFRAHLGEAEVDDFDEVGPGADLLEDDVLGLEVPVDDVGIVRFGECRESLAKNVDDAPGREGPVFVRHTREIAPAQELHHEVELAVGSLAEVDDADRVRMIEAAGRAGLGDEARGGVLLADEVRVDDLHRDRTSEVRLLGSVNPTHAADADQLQNEVSAGQRAPDEGVLRIGDQRAHRKAARRAEPVRFVAGAGALRTRPHGTFSPRTSYARGAKKG